MKYYDRDRIEQVAGAVSELRYKETQELARTLVNMANDREEFSEIALRPEWIADLLADWAESVENEISEAQGAKEAG